MNILNRTVLLGILIWTPLIRADVKPHGLFSDHMVLQGGQKIPVWGTADAGENVTVALAEQKQSATADERGRWRVVFEPINAANEQSMEMQIEGRGANGQTSSRTIRDILIGEVWICSGQSNMDWVTSQAMNGAKEVAEANHPQIRLFHVPHKATEKTQENVEAKWQVCSP